MLYLTKFSFKNKDKNNDFQKTRAKKVNHQQTHTIKKKFKEALQKKKSIAVRNVNLKKSIQPEIVNVGTQNRFYFNI